MIKNISGLFIKVKTFSWFLFPLMVVFLFEVVWYGRLENNLKPSQDLYLKKKKA